MSSHVIRCPKGRILNERKWLEKEIKKVYKSRASVPARIKTYAEQRELKSLIYFRKIVFRQRIEFCISKSLWNVLRFWQKERIR